MATASSPDDLGQIIRDLSRRVKTLETSSRVGFATIAAGEALVVVDNTSTPVLRIGTLNSGGYGIERWSGGAWVAIT